MEDISTNVDENVEERDLAESHLLHSSPTLPSESQLLSSPASDSSWWLENWNLLELSGSCGDFGTLIPLLVALGRQRAIYLAPTLLGTGIVHIICGILIWDIPMPLQPMKAIASLAIASELTRLEVTIAGVGMGVCFLLFGVFGGAIETVHRWIPPSVIGGLQLGVGWKLAIKGIQMIDQLSWIENPYDSKFWSIFSGLLCLYFLRAQQSNHHDHDTAIVGCWQKFRQKFPVGLSLFLLGVLLAVMKLVNGKQTSTGTNDTSKDLAQVDSGSIFSEALVVNALKGSTWENWRKGFLEGTLPQLPLTTLNSCLSVCLLAKSLFPDKPTVKRRTVCWSIGLMNLILCPLGCMPHCHGAGGLAAQYKLGATTGLSMVVLGSLKVLCAFFSGSIQVLLDALPLSVLGVLLVLAGHELALAGVSSVAYPKERTSWTSSDLGSQQDLTVTLMTGLMIVGTGKTHVGTFCGLVTHLLHDNPDLERRRISNYEEAEDSVDHPIEHTRNEEYSPLHHD